MYACPFSGHIFYVISTCIKISQSNLSCIYKGVYCNLILYIPVQLVAAIIQLKKHRLELDPKYSFDKAKLIKINSCVCL